MKTIILIGGFGTRLRPFTLHTPKPLLPILNRPFLHYQFELLKRHGFKDIVLCTSYRPEAFKRALGTGRRWGVKLEYVHETTPLGTGGAIKNAARHIRGTTLVLNGDVLNLMDLREFFHSHQRRGAEASIALTPVPDPTLYGLVELDGSGRVKRFLEKPSPDEVTVNTINAGAYLFEPSIFERIPAGRPCSIERETFPLLLKGGIPFYGYASHGYWLDIGSPEKYMKAHHDMLEGHTPFAPPGHKRDGVWLEEGAAIGPGLSIEGHAAVGRGSRLGRDVKLLGGVSIGPGCAVGDGAVLENVVILAGTAVGAGARLSGCVVGQKCTIGDSVSIGAGGHLGDRSVATSYSQL